MTTLPRRGFTRSGVSELERRSRPPMSPEAFSLDDLPPELQSRWPNKLDRERACRLCERPRAIRPLLEHRLAGEDAVRLTRHHLVPKWWAADAVARRKLRDKRIVGCSANIVPLCRSCHDQVEQDVGMRRMLRRRLLADEVEFVRAVCGDAWLDDVYPTSVNRP